MSSSDIAMSVRGLSKSYTIVHGQQRRPTFRDLLMDRLRNPFKRSAKETFWALKDVSFDIKKGEVVGIIGRNGAGKSTLLKILSRITEPTGGEIDLYGRVGSLLEVGTGFHPELTGRENIFLNGAILGMNRAEIRRQFDAIVDFAEVEKFLDTPVKRYSSGMYVRLAFAVAAHLSSEILIVDEVLAVGDSTFQKKCLGKMSDVARNGRTVLFVSHNMEAVLRLTRRAIWMANGSLVADGPTEDVSSAYLAAPFRDDAARGAYTADGTSTGYHIAQARVRTSENGAVHFFAEPIRFEFSIRTPERSDSLRFTFQILDDAQRAVCHFRPPADRLPWREARGEHLITCEAAKLRLFQGDYSIRTFLSDRTTGTLHECLDGVCMFSVAMNCAPPDEYGWSRGQCAYIEDSAWELGVSHRVLART